jgi:hypothetical protein
MNFRFLLLVFSFADYFTHSAASIFARVLRLTEAQHPLNGRTGALFVATSTTLEIHSKEAHINNCFTAMEENKTLKISYMNLLLNIFSTNNCR